MNKTIVNESITLFDLQKKIGRAIEDSIPDRYWVRAETGEVKINASGHCYIDLIDKEGDSLEIRAKLQAVIWSSTFRMLRPYFETSTGRALERGLNILVYVQVQYSSIYGLSLVITDIDPVFTVGEQELIRLKTIRRLKEEGMMDMNSFLEIDGLPRRIAVISSGQAAGYRDFIKHIHENEYGFRFYTQLFAVPMQGKDAPEGIIAALEKIASVQDPFDIVILIRGGGAVQDLICFDDYELAANIAQFPLPVIVGVGHDHDYHIADMVAHTSVKTPTAAADFIVDLYAREEQHLIFLARRVSIALHTRLQDENNTLIILSRKIMNAAMTFFKEQEHKMDMLLQRIESGDPSRLLGRGYAFVLKEGKRVLVPEDVELGDHIRLLLAKGVLECIVNSKENGK